MSNQEVVVVDVKIPVLSLLVFTLKLAVSALSTVILFSIAGRYVAYALSR